MSKKDAITVQGTNITVFGQIGKEYICITDIARYKNPKEPKDVIKNWMRNRNTIEFLALWEKIYNPEFKGVEIDPLLNESGSNSFTMSPTRWVEITGATGMFTKTGSGGGTYAHKDIAFEFASWISINALLISQGLSPKERLLQLNNVAITQMKSLLSNDTLQKKLK